LKLFWNSQDTMPLTRAQGEAALKHVVRNVMNQFLQHLLVFNDFWGLMLSLHPIADLPF
jgi:hypothetical protein